MRGNAKHTRGRGRAPRVSYIIHRRRRPSVSSGGGPEREGRSEKCRSTLAREKNATYLDKPYCGRRQPPFSAALHKRQAARMARVRRKRPNSLPPQLRERRIAVLDAVSVPAMAVIASLNTRNRRCRKKMRVTLSPER